MNFILWLWRCFALVASAATLIATAIFLLIEPLNIPILLILYGVGYLLSISSILRFFHRRCMYAGGGVRFAVYLLAIILNVVLVPLTLLLSMFGRTFRLINYNVYERALDDTDPRVQRKLAKRELKEEGKRIRRAEKIALRETAEQLREEEKLARKAVKNGEIKPAEATPKKAATKAKKAKKPSKRDLISGEVSEKIRISMWRSSTNRAVNKILDESYKGDIKIDDGVEPKIYKQVALINLSHQKYALLAERDEHGKPASIAEAYAIVPDVRYGNTLTLVEDDALRERVFAVYRALLAEKRIYSA